MSVYVHECRTHMFVIEGGHENKYFVSCNPPFLLSSDLVLFFFSLFLYHFAHLFSCAITTMFYWVYKGFSAPLTRGEREGGYRIYGITKKKK